MQRALSSDSAAPADPLAMPGAIAVHLNGNVAYSRVVFLSNLKQLNCSGRNGILQQQHPSLRLVQSEQATGDIARMHG